MLPTVLGGDSGAEVLHHGTGSPRPVPPVVTVTVVA